MGNFFDCITSRGTADFRRRNASPHDDACHLCNIALMLGRELKWDPEAEKFDRRRAGDDADVAAAAGEVFVGGDDVGSRDQLELRSLAQRRSGRGETRRGLSSTNSSVL